MPALLLRLLLQCAGDIKMNPGPVLTTTPTYCLRLMQWNANGISGKITELLTFLHSNNVNIAAILETKQTYENKLLKTPGWAAVRLDRHKNIDGRLLMLIKDIIPFVDNTAALPQSADAHLEPTRHFHCNAHSPTTAHLHSAMYQFQCWSTHRSCTSPATTRCRLLFGILMCITPDGIQIQMKMKEANN